MTNATNDNHVYKILRLTGTSGESVEAAVRNAIGKAAETVRRLRWFKVVETRGDIAEGRVIHWQVTLDAGFRLDGAE